MVKFSEGRISGKWLMVHYFPEILPSENSPIILPKFYFQQNYNIQKCSPSFTEISFQKYTTIYWVLFESKISVKFRDHFPKYMTTKKICQAEFKFQFNQCTCINKLQSFTRTAEEADMNISFPKKCEPHICVPPGPIQLSPCLASLHISEKRPQFSIPQA